MITINLLPLEYRKAKKSTNALPYVPLAILFAVLFLLLTGFFFADYLKAKSAHEAVYNEWLQLRPQMQQLKALEAKVEMEMRGEKEFLEKHMLNTEPMTLILQRLSEYLPARIWLTELKLERIRAGGRLALQGVVLATSEKTGIEQIEDYMGKLKGAVPKGSFSLTTAKQTEKDAKAGTSFSAVFDWGDAKP